MKKCVDNNKANNEGKKAEGEDKSKVTDGKFYVVANKDKGRFWYLDEFALNEFDHNLIGNFSNWNA